MKQQFGKTTTFDPEAKDTDPVQRSFVHNAAMATATAEFGPLPAVTFGSSRSIWIEAGFRETGLTLMRPGQKATIDVDAYPDVTFKAHIVSMSPGTGSDFAALPPENATGNRVKVVQRLMVRLELDALDPDRPLFSRISVTARVDTGHRRDWHHSIEALSEMVPWELVL
jgi:multidrug resistance efflux pump